jgi:Protein of unknown function (DUF3226)
VSPLPAVPPIAQDYLIVGEGKGDASFFKHLCSARAIDIFQIECADGVGKLPAYLSGLSSRTGFGRLKALLVVRDNDDTPAESFREVAKQLKKAKLPVPQEPLRVKRNKPEEVGVTVMMIPFTAASGPTRGCLESLLLPAIEEHRPDVKACVDTYFGCLAANFTKNQQDKFRVRCSIAAMWPVDPNFGLQYALDPAKNMIPLANPVFDEVADFLREFPVLCSA